jgi:hypothetical protein
MCKSKVRQPDISAQQAEAARQREEELRLAEERRQQDLARWEQQRAADQARADAQIAALTKLQQDQQAAALAAQQQQQAAMEAMAAQAAADRDAERQRQAQERAQQEARAQQRAAAQRQYADGRSAAIGNAQDQINAAFGGFNDDFFNRFAEDFRSYYTPQLSRSFDDATKRVTFGLARTGNLDSSAAADAYGRLAEQRAGAEADIAAGARDTANRFRSDIDNQRRALQSEVFSALSLAPPMNADDISADSALGGISSALGDVGGRAAAAARGIQAPQFGAFSDPFAGISVPGQRSSGRSDFTSLLGSINTGTPRTAARIVR